MRRDIALLLQSGQDATARIRVEHVLREQNILAANEFVELFCELIVQRLSIIAKQRDCPADLKEGISSLIFAAPRCSEIPELVALRDIFEKKYGKDFVSAATDLRPDCGVNRMLIEKLSVRTPAGEVKLKVLKEIAKEYQVEWDTAESETELLKPPEKTLDGPQNFMSASSMPIKPTSDQYVQPVKATSEQFFQQNNPPPGRYSGNGQNEMHFEDTKTAAEQFVLPNNPPSRRYSSNGQNAMHFEDTKSAAEAAAESAKMAIAAAEAAAYLANKHSNQSNQPHESINGSRNGNNFDSFSSSPPINFTKPSRQSSDRSHISSDNTKDQRRYSYNASGVKFDDSDCDEQPEIDDNKMYRRHTYGAPPRVSSVKFDESESDYDEELDMDHDYDHDRATGMNQGPPNRPAPPAPSSGYMKQGQQRVHPKLPDYDTLAARFEALKHGKA
ncbi:regulator of Vps4 activity in the MVB pathway protein [Artemisia annua]|uniref:Regulator of Vps4 activity in the MVB pathway protein n=1 Tax=Artemisia annua TaxID=35608 RepID=A0A2U1NPE2_ARTAN|nr:regulator of Vps4 activity in the MVB pathway protein [Artemisia annua]